MIRILTVTFFTMISLIYFGQNCDYEINEVDKFTGEKKVITNPIKVAEKLKIPKVYKVDKVEWKTKEEGGSRFLVTTYYNALGTMAMAGTEYLWCILEDGNKLKLKIKSNMPSYGRNKMNGVGIVSYDYIVDNEAFDILLKSKITDVRAEAFMNGIDYSLSNANTTNLFKCIK